jgi:ADP-L-glycero-D-manno-heptose 6-epimerase
MKILLTGHKGFIGSNMLKMLDGHEVVTYNWGDALPLVAGLDWVVHMGAISSTIERNIEKIMLQNYDFSCWLLNECIANNVNFQYSSSASIYGLGTEFVETSPVDPRTPYAWTKYLFERFANRECNIRIQGFRYFNVYGSGEEEKGDQASPFYKFKKQAEENGFVKLFENSQHYRRDFVPVKQVCQTHIDFFNVKESGVWNVGTGAPISFYDVAKQFTDNIIEVPLPDILKDSYQEFTCADMTKTNTSLGR